MSENRISPRERAAALICLMAKEQAELASKAAAHGLPRYSNHQFEVSSYLEEAGRKLTSGDSEEGAEEAPVSDYLMTGRGVLTVRYDEGPVAQLSGRISAIEVTKADGPTILTIQVDN